jgi:CDP-2,3-bis-(O-geranylgeranyl)-sn-glycerol synthase
LKSHASNIQRKYIKLHEKHAPARAEEKGFLIYDVLIYSMNSIIELILFIMPAYFANAVPVLLGGGPPLDFGKNFYDNERILGNGKTIRGFVAGVAAGVVVACLLAFTVHIEFFENQKTQLFGGIMLSFGTMVGDSLGSFIKRRMHVKEGKQFFLDTILFLIVALIFAYPFASRAYTYFNIGILLILTVILHPFANFIANRIGLKSVPW